MDDKKQFSASQNRIWYVASIVSAVGNYAFLSSQVDIKEPFVIGVYLICTFCVIWATRHFVERSIDSDGRLIRRKNIKK